MLSELAELLSTLSATQITSLQQCVTDVENGVYVTQQKQNADLDRDIKFGGDSFVV
jgi:hypothetical protein